MDDRELRLECLRLAMGDVWNAERIYEWLTPAGAGAPPAFEVRDRQTGHAYRVYEDGRIEGFPDGATVVNRIPQLCASAAARARLDARQEGQSLHGAEERSAQTQCPGATA